MTKGKKKKEIVAIETETKEIIATNVKNDDIIEIDKIFSDTIIKEITTIVVNATLRKGEKDGKNYNIVILTLAEPILTKNDNSELETEFSYKKEFVVNLNALNNIVALTNDKIDRAMCRYVELTNMNKNVFPFYLLKSLIVNSEITIQQIPYNVGETFINWNGIETKVENRFIKTEIIDINIDNSLIKPFLEDVKSEIKEILG